MNDFQKILTALLCSFSGWLLCAVVMFVGMKLVSLQNALIIHAISTPFIFALITGIYIRKYPKVSELKLAFVFTGSVIFMDVFVVAILINKSFAMFSSILGTWLPFGLIFLATYFVAKKEKK